MKIVSLFLPLSLVAGCAQYSQVQMDLLAQARSGVKLTQESLNNKSQIASAYYDLQRRRLDDAFDADVNAKASQLSADWVIEHRRAYAVGVASIEQAKAAASAADDTDRKNLADIDQAIERAIWLQSIQLQYLKLPQELINHEQH